MYNEFLLSLSLSLPLEVASFIFLRLRQKFSGVSNKTFATLKFERLLLISSAGAREDFQSILKTLHLIANSLHIFVT